MGNWFEVAKFKTRRVSQNSAGFAFRLSSAAMLMYNARRLEEVAMNAVNRFLVIVQLLIAIALMPISIALVLFNRAGIAGFLTNLARSVNEGPSVFMLQLICVGVALLVFVVSIILLFLELQRAPSRRLRVQQIADGQVEITDDAIVQRLEHSIGQIADVLRVKPRVVPASKGKAVDVLIELETNPEVNVPQKTQEVIAAAKQVMEQQMGLAVHQVQVQLDYSRKQTKPQA
jgi:hypothetical protein